MITKKTLIIHLDDPTTRTLCPIYENMDNKTVVTNKLDNHLLKTHNRIIMLGHGSPFGLFGHKSYLISKDNAKLLKHKKDSIFIWCHANRFTKEYNLPGFATGMFISELEEANCFAVECTQEDIDVSTKLFVDIIVKYLNEPTDVLSQKVFEEYKIDNNKVVEFNRFEMFEIF